MRGAITAASKHGVTTNTLSEIKVGKYLVGHQFSHL